MSDKTQIDAYLENLEPDRRTALAELRSQILETVPGVVETMRYRMPMYEYAGGVLCAFASQKNYMSLYMDTEVVERHRKELDSLSIGKSCIRFRKLDELPLDTVELMLLETVQGARNM